MDVDTINAFQGRALEQGLIHANAPWGDEFFSYKLACMTASGPKDPEKVLQLVQMAREYAQCEEKGPHRALLGLSVKRIWLNYTCVEWSREAVQSDQDRRLSLEEWLIEQGHPYQALHAVAA